MTNQQSLTYTYLTSLTHKELLEVEALAIRTQDIDTLARISKIRCWSVPTRPVKEVPAPKATFTYLKEEVEDVVFDNQEEADFWGNAY